MGRCRSSPCVLKLPSAIQMNGMRVSRRPTTRAVYVAPRDQRTGRRGRRPGAVSGADVAGVVREDVTVMSILLRPQQAELDGGQRGDQREEHVRGRGGEGVVAVAELVVDVVADGQRGVDRAALG